MAQNEPKMAQDEPKTAQDEPKTAQDKHLEKKSFQKSSVLIHPSLNIAILVQEVSQNCSRNLPKSVKKHIKQKIPKRTLKINICGAILGIVFAQK